jgi:deoxyribodipyrimidine photolyase
MQKLYDADLSANNGGWQWSASSGMDPKPVRIFNPASQAKKFDPEGEYIREWLPELRSVDTEFLISGDIPPMSATLLIILPRLWITKNSNANLNSAISSKNQVKQNYAVLFSSCGSLCP